MSTTSADLNHAILDGSERHTCGKLEDHWVMIVVKDNEGIIWDNSTIGGPEFEAPKNGPIVMGIAFCPFCGMRLGEPDETTEAVTEIVESAMAGEDNQNYHNYTVADLKKLQRVLGEFYAGNLQITVLDPHLNVK